MIPTIQNKIKFKIKITKWSAILMFIILIVPLYYSIFKSESIDEPNFKFSLFVIIFSLSCLECLFIMIIDIIITKRIEHFKDNIEVVNVYRKKATIINNTLGTIYVITLVSAFVLPSLNLKFIVFFGGFLVVYCILGFYILGTFYKVPSNIKLKDLNKGSYILYLRAFSEDVNSFKQRATPGYFGGFIGFIEEEFLKHFPTSIAVGQPGEIFSRGAKRIYFKENEWKDSVKIMIDECEFLIIHISSNPNCIWEIINLQKRINKTIFIVSNKEEYLFARSKLIGVIDMPSFVELKPPFAFFFIAQTRHYKFIKFENNVESYLYLSTQIKSIMASN